MSRGRRPHRQPLPWLLLLALGCSRGGEPAGVGPAAAMVDAAAQAPKDGGEDGGKDSNRDGGTDVGTGRPRPEARTAAGSARVLRLRVPVFLPCRDFGALQLDRSVRDVIEWWQPSESGQWTAAPTLRLSAEERPTTLPLQPGFVLRGPAVLRFLRRPEQAADKQGLSLVCRDKARGLVHWSCHDGACEPSVFADFPRGTAYASVVPDRFALRWSCGYRCRTPRALDRLLVKEHAFLLEQGAEWALRPSTHPQLVRAAREVAADLAGFIAASCRGDRCSGAPQDARAQLEQLAQRPTLELTTARIAHRAEQLHELDVAELWLDPRSPTPPEWPVFVGQFVSGGGPAGEAELRLTLSCEFENSQLAPVVNTGCNARLERRSAEPAGRGEWQRVLTATLNQRDVRARGVTLASGGRLFAHDRMPMDDLPMQLQITADALAGAQPPPEDGVKLPAPVPPPPLSAIELVTRWPQARLCSAFSEASIEYTHGVRGLEWRGPGPEVLLRLFPEPDKDKDKDKDGRPTLSLALTDRHKLQLTPTSGDGRALWGLTTVRLHPAEGELLGRRSATLKIGLRCQQPQLADVEFSCAYGTCTTTAQRDFPVKDPVGGSYLGPRGWDCIYGGRCPHQRDLERLTKASPEKVQGEYAPSVVTLARDLLGELAAVIDRGCPELCRSPVRAAAHTARQLLASELQIESVRARSRQRLDSADRVVGFVAELRPVIAAAGSAPRSTPAQPADTLAELRWELDCRRETEFVGALGPSSFSRCTGTLRAGKTVLLRYVPSFEQGDTRNGPHDLESYEQLVEFDLKTGPDGEQNPTGTLTVQTGFSYDDGGGPSDRQPDFLKRREISGRIEVWGSALRLQ